MLEKIEASLYVPTHCELWLSIFFIISWIFQIYWTGHHCIWTWSPRLSALDPPHQLPKSLFKAYTEYRARENAYTDELSTDESVRRPIFFTHESRSFPALESLHQLSNFSITASAEYWKVYLQSKQGMYRPDDCFSQLSILFISFGSSFASFLSSLICCFPCLFAMSSSILFKNASFCTRNQYHVVCPETQILKDNTDCQENDVRKCRHRPSKTRTKT